MALNVARSNDCAAAPSPKATCNREGSAATPMVIASGPLLPSIVSVPLNTDADGDGFESANAECIGSAPSAPMASVADAAIPTGPMLSFERMVMACPLSGRDRHDADHQQNGVHAMARSRNRVGVRWVTARSAQTPP